MYAIIRAGGKQAKVQSGDVLEIERVKSGAEELTFSPLLVVDDNGNAVSDRALLEKATVKAKVLGETAGDKVDIFKYKSKTGYRRHQGHRQKYTQIEITGIDLPGAAKKAAASKPAGDVSETKAATSKRTPSKTTAGKTTTKTTATKAAAKKPAATKTAKAVAEEE
jgi:large subunit ribosomal protein L21